MKAVFLAAVAMLATTSEGKVIEIPDQASFDKLVGPKGRDHYLVKFAVKWCGTCKKMKPSYDKLSEELHLKHGSKMEPIQLKYAEVDCTEDAQLAFCRELQVNEYPTLRFYEVGKDVEDSLDHQYSGGRYSSVSELTAWAKHEVAGAVERRNKRKESGGVKRKTLNEMMGTNEDMGEDMYAQYEKWADRKEAKAVDPDVQRKATQTVEEMYKEMGMEPPNTDGAGELDPYAEEA